MIPYWSARFEQAVAEWVSKRGYDEVECNYYPPYLQESGGEIDVYASDHRGSPRRILICECKLRIEDPDRHPVTLEEVAQLRDKKDAVEKLERGIGAQKGYQPKINAWLVTNARTASEGAVELAKQCGIELMHARIPGPQTWRKRANWKVNSLERITTVI